jgi:hypothetical protein
MKAYAVPQLAAHKTTLPRAIRDFVEVATLLFVQKQQESLNDSFRYKGRLGVSIWTWEAEER